MIKLVFCGDIVSYDLTQVKIAPQIYDTVLYADISACNFEAPIETDSDPAPKSGPSIFQHKNNPSMLEAMGFNVIQLANNHLMDYGAKGCRNTISSFKSAITIGAGEPSNAYKPAIIDVKGKKIALISLTHKEFGTLSLDSPKDECGTAWINHPYVNSIIKETKKKCDYVIVLPHAGVEGISAPLPEWRIRYKEFVDYGADAVIASHPHVPQGWEEYKGKPIFYSLGNFFFFKPNYKHASACNTGLMIELSIGDDGIDYNVINTKFSDNELFVIPKEETQEHNSYLCDLLTDEEKYNSYVNKSVLDLWKDYQMYMLRGLGAMSCNSNFNTIIHTAYGVLKGADKLMLLNNFQCESHRWAIERAIKLQLIKK